MYNLCVCVRVCIDVVRDVEGRFRMLDEFSNGKIEVLVRMFVRIIENFSK